MEDFLQKKQIKLRKTEEIISPTKDYIKNKNNFDFLPNSLPKEYDLKTTENISAHGYDRFARELIEKNREGLILDCGSGKRPEYLDNVVNFEIVPYETTDVLGIGEKLPFIDNSFDAVLSLNVLEHVRDPFKCAAEISRVLKPEGKIITLTPEWKDIYKSFYDDYTHRTPFTKKSLEDIHHVTGFKNVEVQSFKQLPILWSDNLIIRSSFSILSEITRLLIPEKFRMNNKWFRFSKELMAKYYSAWGNQPHLVKKGGEKIFRYFIEKLSGEG